MSDVDRQFDSMLRSARERLEHEIETEAPEPDIADLVARAHEMDPKFVTWNHVTEADSLARVIRPRFNGGPSQSSDVDFQLRVLVSDTGAEVEKMVQKRRLAAIGTCPPVTSSKRVRVRLFAGASVVAMGLAAAALLLFFSPSVVSPTAVSTPSAALFSERDDGMERWTEHRGYRVIAPVRESATPVLESSATPALESSDTIPSALHQDGQSLAESELPLSDRIRDLDGRAQVLWREGDLRGASGLFQEIIRIGGRHPLVEAAYADLLAIIHQTGEVRRREQLWSRYLRKFPNGRFADDAQAGLCQGLQGMKERECWEEYLDKRPRGTYRDVARDVLSRSKDDKR